MRKFISFILSLIIFIITFSLIMIININILLSHRTIEKISNNTNYLNLVNIKTESSEIKKQYDDIYLSIKTKTTNENVKKIYNSNIPSQINTKILDNEIKYLLIDYNTKLLNRSSYDILIKQELNNMNITPIQIDTNKIVIIEDIIRNKINLLTPTYKNIIKYILGNEFKIIILCLLIINIIFQYLLNKKNYLPHIFIPIIIVNLLEIIISIILTPITKNYLTNEFIITFITPYLELFSTKLLLMNVGIFLISILYLMINEYIINKSKVFIKPKIKCPRNCEEII